MLEVVTLDFQQQTGFAGLDQQAFGIEQLALIEAGRAGQRRNRRQGLQMVLVEHLFQALYRHGFELAARQLFQTIEVQQLALREQHHQCADLVIQQDRLYP
ncbi:hypothetical protein D3C76_1440010 [compost metagenome]